MNVTQPATASSRYFDANRIKCSVQNNGIFARNPFNGASDFTFDGIGLIYLSGLWIAAKVNGEVRASAADYLTDFAPGAIDDQGNPFGKEDSTFRVYKINRGDDAFSDIDYAQWPAQFGAPIDEAGNPKLFGDQTLWCSFVDNFAAAREVNICNPLGAEVHMTVWGTETIDDVMFLRWEIINRSQTVWDSLYLGLFIDPDLFYYSDDLVACDSTLNLVYCYDARDQLPFWYYALGYQMLESPIVFSPGDTAVTFKGLKIDYKNVPVATPRVEKNIGGELSGWNHIAYRTQHTAQDIYYRLMCLDNYGNPAIDPITQKPTRWIFSGDPVTGTGWLDDLPVRDRWMMISAGPVTLAPVDTTAMTVAVIAAKSSVLFESIPKMKQRARWLKQMFKNQIYVSASATAEIKDISAEEAEVRVRVPVSATGLFVSSVEAQLKKYDGTLVATFPLHDDGAHFDEEPGDDIFGGSYQLSRIDDALYLNVIVVDNLSDTHLIEYAAENITLTQKVNFELIVDKDGINQNGEINPGEWALMRIKVINNYDFDLKKIFVNLSLNDSLVGKRKGYFYLDSLAANSSGEITFDYDLRPFRNYMLLYFPQDIPLNYLVNFQFQAGDYSHHFWQGVTTIAVKPLPYQPEEIQPEQISGKSDAYFKINIVDPTKLTGHSYTITINDSLDEYKRYFSIIDQNLGRYVLYNSPRPDYYGIDQPVIDGFKVKEFFYVWSGKLDSVYFQGVEPEKPCPFEGVPFSGAEYFNNGIEQNPMVDDREMWAVEIEFTNEINADGVVGEPAGQGAFRYVLWDFTHPTGFFRCPFNVWKIVKGERVGKLNVCFTEYPNGSRMNGIWDPDTSSFGASERLYVMKTDYDPSGTAYLFKPLDFQEYLYKILLRLKSGADKVNVGDKFVFDWKYPTTSEDAFVFSTTGVEKKDVVKKYQFQLKQNYPNPFNNATRINFTLPEQRRVSLKIYNILGQEVIELFDREMPAGEHVVLWEGKNSFGEQVPSGMYFARLKSGKKNRVIKLLLIE